MMCSHWHRRPIYWVLGFYAQVGSSALEHRKCLIAYTHGHYNRAFVDSPAILYMHPTWNVFRRQHCCESNDIC